MTSFLRTAKESSVLLKPGALRLEGPVKWALFLAPVAYVLFLSWLDPALPWPVPLSTLQPWALALLNVVPVLIVNAAFLVITRRLVLSHWLTVLVLGAVYFVNHIKMQELATPLLPDDFRFLKTIGVSYSFFAHYLANAQLQVLFAALALAITLLLFRREPAIPVLRGRPRWAIALGALILAMSLMHGSAPWRAIYNAGRLQFEPWAPRDSAARTGIITNMLLFYWELRGDLRAGTDLENARRLFHAHSPSIPLPLAADQTTLPDIIIVQSESLFDPSRLSGVEYDALPHMRAAANRGWSGDLYVPTFGGGTIRTEFEVLTGLPLAAFNGVRYPYLQLTRSEIPGLVRELGANGYSTLAIHPNGGAFWNRNDAFRSFGFDRFIDGDSFEGADQHGWYVSDAALVDRIIAEFDDIDPEQTTPRMVMAISIQNHGPYEDVPLGTAVRPEVDVSGLDDGPREALQTYLEMAQATDAQMKRLMDFVDARERPTLLLIYSDHMPPLNRVFAQLSFEDGRGADQQPVPWLLIDNRSREVRTGDYPSWFLPAVVLEKAGIADSHYFSLLRQFSSEQDSSCRCGTPSEATIALAQLQYFDELDGELREYQQNFSQVVD